MTIHHKPLLINCWVYVFGGDDGVEPVSVKHQLSLTTAIVNFPDELFWEVNEQKQFSQQITYEQSPLAETMNTSIGYVFTRIEPTIKILIRMPLAYESVSCGSKSLSHGTFGAEQQTFCFTGDFVGS